AGNLEDVEVAGPADGHDDHPLALVPRVVRVVGQHLCVEGLLVEADEAIHVRRQDGDVVDAIQGLHPPAPLPSAIAYGLPGGGPGHRARTAASSSLQVKCYVVGSPTT